MDVDTMITPLGWLEEYFPGEENEKLYMSLVNLRNQASKVLDSQLFHHYTDHSLGHSDRVLENCRHLLADNLERTLEKGRLNVFELSILVAGCYLHDIGMQTPMFEQQKLKQALITEELCEGVRKKHREIACDLIDDSLKEQSKRIVTLGLDQNTYLQELIPYIKEICKSHTGEYKNYDRVDTIFGKDIRIGFLVGLLRLADALDLSQLRVDMDRLKRFDIPIESKVHWWRCYYVKSITIRDGIISFYMSVTNLDPLIAEFFKSSIINSINDEKKKSDVILHKNFVRFVVNMGVDIEGDEINRKKIPTPLLMYIKRKIQDTCGTYSEVQKKMEYFNPVKSSKNDWMSHWGFVGNPFKDEPLTCKGQEFVETGAIKIALDEMSSLAISKGGELKLLVGARGSGKTTFFHVAQEALEDEPLRIRYLDVATELVDLKHPADLSNFIVKNGLYPLIAEEEKEFSDKTFRGAIRDYHYYKYIVFIDTLDVFDEPDEIEIIRKFFRMNQNYLQEFKRKFLLVVSSSPKWKEIFQERDLSYLGYENCWRLEPFKKNDVKKLIENRLKIYSKSINDLIDDDAISLIASMTEGNPRRVLQRMENICKEACFAGLNKITRAFIEKGYGESVWATRRGIILEVGNRSKYYAEALSRIYMFYDKMENAGLEIDRGFDYLKTAYDDRVRIEDMDSEFSQALYVILTRFSTFDKTEKLQVSYIMRQQVRDYLKEVEKLGVNIDDFILTYKDKQIVPTAFDKSLEDIIEVPHVKDEAKDFLKSGTELYSALLVGNIPPPKVIITCWDCIENIAKASLIHHDIMLPEKVRATTKKDHLNRVRMTSRERIQEGKFYLNKIHELPKKVGYISSMPEIVHVLRKRNQVLNTPPAHFSQFGEKDALASLNSLKRAYPELISLF